MYWTQQRGRQQTNDDIFWWQLHFCADVMRRWDEGEEFAEIIAPHTATEVFRAFTRVCEHIFSSHDLTNSVFHNEQRACDLSLWFQSRLQLWVYSSETFDVAMGLQVNWRRRRAQDRYTLLLSLIVTLNNESLLFENDEYTLEYCRPRSRHRLAVAASLALERTSTRPTKREAAAPGDAFDVIVKQIWTTHYTKRSVTSITNDIRELS